MKISKLLPITLLYSGKVKLWSVISIILISNLLLSSVVQAAPQNVVNCYGSTVSIDYDLLNPDEAFQIGTQDEGDNLKLYCLSTSPTEMFVAHCVNSDLDNCNYPENGAKKFVRTQAQSTLYPNPNAEFDYDQWTSVEQAKIWFITEQMNPGNDPVIRRELQNVFWCYSDNLCNSAGGYPEYNAAEALIHGANVTVTQVTANPAPLNDVHIFQVDAESGYFILDVGDGGADPFLCDVSGNPVTDPDITVTATRFRDDNFNVAGETYHLCLTRSANASFDFTASVGLWRHPLSETGSVWYPENDSNCQGMGVAEILEYRNSATTAQWGAASTGSITIIKDATPDDPQDFAFTATGTGVSNFSLDDDSDGTLSNTQTFTGLADGVYSFTEGVTANWTLAGISCSGATNSTVTINATGVDITLSDNENISCTFYNNSHSCPAGQILNQATITANESETTFANNTAAACLEVANSCSLTASAVVSSCTNVGSDADGSNDTFTIDLTVQGTNTSGSTNYSYTSSSANVSGSGTYSATAETDGAFVISATTSPFSLTIQDDNDAGCSTTVTNLIAPETCSTASPQVDLELVKIASATEVLSGDTLTYTLTLTNNGPNDATGISVTDNLPAGVTYSSDTPSQGSYDSGTGIWTVGDLALGATATLEIVVTIN